MAAASEQLEALKDHRRQMDASFMASASTTPKHFTKQLTGNRQLELRAASHKSAVWTAQHSGKSLALLEDSQYRELCSVLDRVDEYGGSLPEWQRHIILSLRGLMTQVQLTKDAVVGEQQLRSVYRWFKANKNAFPSDNDSVAAEDGGVATDSTTHCRAPTAAELEASFFTLDFDEGGRTIEPGSVFYHSAGGDDQGELSPELKPSSNLEGGASAPLSKVPQVQLASASERIKAFQKHSLVGPLTARRLRDFRGLGTACRAGIVDSCCASPEPNERSYTPSTATGGGVTSRSIASARSTPTPGRSTPTHVRGTPTPGRGTPTQGRCTPSFGSRPSSAIGAAAPRRPLRGRPVITSVARDAGSDGDVGAPATTALRPPPMPPQPQQQPTLRAGGASPLQPPAPAPTYVAPEFRHPQVPTLSLPLQPSPSGVRCADVGAVAIEPSPQEIAMQERWLARRNREITAQAIAKEQHSAVQAWVQRRTRVEEEIQRNVEVARFQSELAQRRYCPPFDAEEDIEATVPEPDESSTCQESNQSGAEVTSAAEQAAPSRSRQAGGLRTAQRASRTVPIRPASAAPRFDVSRISVDQQEEGRPTSISFKAGLKEERRPLNNRIAYLRNLHSHCLQATEAECSESDSEEPSPYVFATEGQHVSLSVYTPAGESQREGPEKPQAPRWEDESDVLAGTCDWWRNKTSSDEGPLSMLMKLGDGTLDEMRFQQLQEVEAIKKVFARRNCPVNAAVLELALVMPPHRFKARVAQDGAPLHNADPSSLVWSTFMNSGIGKKKKKVKGAKRSTSASKRSARRASAKPATRQRSSKKSLGRKSVR